MPNVISPAVSGRIRCTGRTDRERRLSRLEWAILALTALALAAAALSAAPSSPTSGLPTTTVRVRSGDTLWSIASEHPVAGLETARTADLIAEMNNFEGAALREGSAILVPVDASRDAVAMR